MRFLFIRRITSARPKPSIAMNLINSDLSDFRLSYTSGSLDDAVRNNDPLTLFDQWLQDAKTTEHEPNAMCLSTVGSDSRPNARIVLLKAFDSKGFVFYTNYESRKSKNLAVNPFASLTFYWKERQVRIEGLASKTTPQESDAYFATRPRGSQIGAWVSNFQSSKVESRAVLEEREKQLEAQFEGVDVIPRPEFWGGWRVDCDRIEFWQGRPGRIHDRILFEKRTDASNGTDSSREWNVSRLMP